MLPTKRLTTNPLNSPPPLQKLQQLYTDKTTKTPSNILPWSHTSPLIFLPVGVCVTGCALKIKTRRDHLYIGSSLSTYSFFLSKPLCKEIHAVAVFLISKGILPFYIQITYSPHLSPPLEGKKGKRGKAFTSKRKRKTKLQNPSFSTTQHLVFFF